ncbi:MAG: hypothetical protein LKF82_03345 [Acinetobacter populi]|uniref:hypothetical protein n=1 Tax=Acinetobacter populi TaxID=1582270 RepID=UPI002357C693|nr:hypothetical protein [Acinetobacter populi]MCH4246864.1 hypothetical protein [Acinetobacter populi]
MSGCSIVLGKETNSPLIEIRVTEETDGVTYIQLPCLENLKSFASIAVQAVPSLLTQAEVAKSSIMEVVINGGLAKAADGDGFRAIVKGADGKIIENARLYNADKLSNLVTAAAVWQIASVVVAQKHLADINKKLDDLKDGIDRIQSFQQTERKSNIFMISDKLKEKIMILMRTKNQKNNVMANLTEMDSYDNTLKKIYLHLKTDLKTYGFKKTEHKEIFGTADYKNDLENKILEIQEYLDFAYLCLNLRSINTSLIDYIDGNDDLVEYRTSEIEKEILNLNDLIKNIGKHISGEIQNLKSKTNDMQSFFKNSKETITTGTSRVSLVAGIIRKPDTIGSTSIFYTKLFGEDKKIDILEERKHEMLKKLNKFLHSSEKQVDYSIKLANTNLHQLIEKEKPIKLAFQKIDDNYVLCLNTNEKIPV